MITQENLSYLLTQIHGIEPFSDEEFQSLLAVLGRSSDRLFLSSYEVSAVPFLVGASLPGFMGAFYSHPGRAQLAATSLSDRGVGVVRLAPDYPPADLERLLESLTGLEARVVLLPLTLLAREDDLARILETVALHGWNLVLLPDILLDDGAIASLDEHLRAIKAVFGPETGARVAKSVTQPVGRLDQAFAVNVEARVQEALQASNLTDEERDAFIEPLPREESGMADDRTKKGPAPDDDLALPDLDDLGGPGAGEFPDLELPDLDLFESEAGGGEGDVLDELDRALTDDATPDDFLTGGGGDDEIDLSNILGGAADEAAGDPEPDGLDALDQLLQAPPEPVPAAAAGPSSANLSADDLADLGNLDDLLGIGLEEEAGEAGPAAGDGDTIDLGDMLDLGDEDPTGGSGAHADPGLDDLLADAGPGGGADDALDLDGLLADSGTAGADEDLLSAGTLDAPGGDGDELDLGDLLGEPEPAAGDGLALDLGDSLSELAGDGGTDDGFDLADFGDLLDESASSPAGAPAVEEPMADDGLELDLGDLLADEPTGGPGSGAPGLELADLDEPAGDGSFDLDDLLAGPEDETPAAAPADDGLELDLGEPFPDLEEAASTPDEAAMPDLVLDPEEGGGDGVETFDLDSLLVSDEEGLEAAGDDGSAGETGDELALDLGDLLVEEDAPGPMDALADAGDPGIPDLVEDEASLFGSDSGSGLELDEPGAGAPAEPLDLDLGDILEDGETPAESGPTLDELADLDLGDALGPDTLVLEPVGGAQDEEGPAVPPGAPLDEPFDLDLGDALDDAGPSMEEELEDFDATGDLPAPDRIDEGSLLTGDDFLEIPGSAGLGETMEEEIEAELDRLEADTSPGETALADWSEERSPGGDPDAGADISPGPAPAGPPSYPGVGPVATAGGRGDPVEPDLESGADSGGVWVLSGGPSDEGAVVDVVQPPRSIPRARPDNAIPVSRVLDPGEGPARSPGAAPAGSAHGTAGGPSPGRLAPRDEGPISDPGLEIALEVVSLAVSGRLKLVTGSPDAPEPTGVAAAGGEEAESGGIEWVDEPEATRRRLPSRPPESETRIAPEAHLPEGMPCHLPSRSPGSETRIAPEAHVILDWPRDRAAAPLPPAGRAPRGPTTTSPSGRRRLPVQEWRHEIEGITASLGALGSLVAPGSGAPSRASRSAPTSRDPGRPASAGPVASGLPAGEAPGPEVPPPTGDAEAAAADATPSGGALPPPDAILQRRHLQRLEGRRPPTPPIIPEPDPEPDEDPPESDDSGDGPAVASPAGPVDGEAMDPVGEEPEAAEDEVEVGARLPEFDPISELGEELDEALDEVLKEHLEPVEATGSSPESGVRSPESVVRPPAAIDGGPEGGCDSVIRGIPGTERPAPDSDLRSADGSESESDSGLDPGLLSDDAPLSIGFDEDEEGDEGEDEQVVEDQEGPGAVRPGEGVSFLEAGPGDEELVIDEEAVAGIDEVRIDDIRFVEPRSGRGPATSVTEVLRGVLDELEEDAAEGPFAPSPPAAEFAADPGSGDRVRAAPRSEPATGPGAGSAPGVFPSGSPEEPDPPAEPEPRARAVGDLFELPLDGQTYFDGIEGGYHRRRDFLEARWDDPDSTVDTFFTMLPRIEESFPEDPRVSFALGILYNLAERRVDGLTALQRALARLEEIGDPEGQEACLEILTTLFPEDIGVAEKLGALYESTGQASKAAGIYFELGRTHSGRSSLIFLERALHLDPARRDAALALARAHRSQGQEKAALDAIGRTLEHHPHDPVLMATKAVSLVRLGRGRAASTLMDQALTGACHDPALLGEIRILVEEAREHDFLARVEALVDREPDGAGDEPGDALEAGEQATPSGGDAPARGSEAPAAAGPAPSPRAGPQPGDRPAGEEPPPMAAGRPGRSSEPVDGPDPEPPAGPAGPAGPVTGRTPGRSADHAVEFFEGLRIRIPRMGPDLKALEGLERELDDRRTSGSLEDRAVARLLKSIQELGDKLQRSSPDEARLVYQHGLTYVPWFEDHISRCLWRDDLDQRLHRRP